MITLDYRHFKNATIDVDNTNSNSNNEIGNVVKDTNAHSNTRHMNLCSKCKLTIIINHLKKLTKVYFNVINKMIKYYLKLL